MRAVLLLLTAGLALAGIVTDDTPIPPPGEPGAPNRVLTAAERARFIRGRGLFDKDFLPDAGIGPVFNGDSCRACHQDPVIGGAGGIDVQVQRPAGAPPETGVLAQTHSVFNVPREEIPEDIAFVEERNSPTLLGLGRVQGISDDAILAGEDPDDDNGDGIFGFAHVLDDGAIGKLGWKADIPDLRSFIRDAMGNEMGITVPITGSVFGFVSDDDAAADPEIGTRDIEDLLFFLEALDFPPKGPPSVQGEQVFTRIGCAKCHTPMLDRVELYSNLLLHDVMPPGFLGVTQGLATSGFYRTAPLRGLRDTAPYFHDGRSATVDDAIRRHDGEAREVREAYEALTREERTALLAFLDSL